MLGEVLAYLYGRSVGREQGRRQRQRPKKLAQDDVIRMRMAAMAVLFCIIIVIVVGLVGDSPY